MAYYSFPTGKRYKKENVRKLNNPPKNFEADFYKID